MHVRGWAEPPRYDRAAHHLVWALTGHVDGDDGDCVNFDTRILGRHGVVSLDLLVAPEDLAASKPEVALLLQGTSFQTGGRYEDFVAKSDKVASSD